MKLKRAHLSLVLVLVLKPTFGLAQDHVRPYFITYDHYMEEKGALEIAGSSVLGRAAGINTFFGSFTEFEYGVTKWWTSAAYLDWQHTRHEGSLFTGFRFENRFRPWLEEHRINPVLYVEYEHLNGADKALLEIVGFDSKEDLKEPNDETRHEHERELETKLILSSNFGKWNLAENFIGVKNVHEGQWEFGYALGLSRPLAAPTGRRCTFCAERFVAGAELYGGLGEWDKFTLRGTSQYVAPVLLWTLPTETSIRISPGWGLTDESVTTLFRIGVSQEFDDVARRIGKLFRKH